jgi:hypothetical protein
MMAVIIACGRGGQQEKETVGDGGAKIILGPLVGGRGGDSQPTGSSTDGGNQEIPAPAALGTWPHPQCDVVHVHFCCKRAGSYSITNASVAAPSNGQGCLDVHEGTDRHCLIAPVRHGGQPLNDGLRRSVHLPAAILVWAWHPRHYEAILLSQPIPAP